MLLTFWLCLGLIIYVYLGYPILITGLASVRQRPIDVAPIYPTVSLIVSAYNEEGVIGKKIENCLSLHYPKELLEIIVVTDGSTDRTPSIVSAYVNRNRIKLLHSPLREGKAAAMNRAAADARGEILIFSDANAMYNADSLQMLVRNFNDAHVGCVNGKKMVYKSQSSIFGSEKTYWNYESHIKLKETQLGSTVGVSGEMIAVRAALFEPVPIRMILDDSFIAMQVLKKNFRVVYEPTAISYEYSSISTHSEVMRRQRISAGRFQMLFSARELWPWNDKLAIFELVSHKIMRLFLPFFSVGVFVSSAGLVLSQNTPAIVTMLFVIQLVFCLFAFVGWIFERYGWHVGVLGILYYIASGNFASFRGLMGYSKGRQTVLWEKAHRIE